MKTKGYLTAFFALFLLTGGLIGYFVAHSTASLVMSSIFATLLLIAAIALLREQVWALYFAIALCTVLTIFFAYRFAINPNFMPALMSLCSLGVSLQLYFEKNKNVKQ